LVDLFDWEEQEAEINLSWSGVEPYTDLDKLDMDDREPEVILSEWYGVRPENILIVHGAQEGIFLTYIALRPDEIHIPLPTYPPIVDQARELGIKIRYTGLEPKLRGKIISLANPNNPTGYYIDLEPLAEDNLVIVDEIFKPYVDEEPYIHENIITIGGSSKFYSIEGRKVGWIVAEKRVIRRIKLARDLITPPPIHDQELIKYIFKNHDYFKENNLNIIKRNLETLNRRNKYFKQIYNKYMPITLLHRETIETMQFCRILHEKMGVLVTPSEYFMMNHGIRISLGARDTKLIETAINRINRLLEDMGMV
jgi:aspartate/methionine/tyrosine aminotransferase